ncbi:MAG: 2-C-methyl-D-erythritol 2,4-cyclodiphosphate synthase [Gemmatimonadales bacterium]|nr:2-C-methyl-D-erythritol 2,4-cyclodiphosphate synthase [bacterium HR33]GIW51114.1 MAG: 2-C-methyl-D-erythritol 2,4-cyclodiphosphate synthase [Gemmatimonadales bacterium]
MRQRFGIGYDSHRFGAERPLVLGGVKIENETGLLGHSDGDAVAHAVIDALLGAAAMGDIGQLFPDTDERWKDANSMQLLREVKRRLTAASYTIVNVDVTVVTERPRLAPHIPAMRENLARALGIPLHAVSVKAKTNEQMDSVGEGKGLQVFAVASLGGA